MKSRFVASFCSIFALIFCVPECQAWQNADQKGAAIASPTRPLPPVGPYFRELAERAKKTGHAYDRFKLFRELDEVLSTPGGSVVPGCGPGFADAPAGGYDSREQAYRDLRDLFDKGDAHAGYLLNSHYANERPTLEIAHLRGDPYAALDVLGLIPRSKRTPDQSKEIDRALAKLEALAEKGDRQAMYRLAQCFRTLGKERADYWYEKLKEQPDRMTYKAILNRSVLVFPRDGKLVLEAAEHGEARAMSELSEHFYYGNMPYTGLAMTDLEKAWFWLRKFRAAVGCPSPEEAPPIDMNTDKPWKKPKFKQVVRKG